MKQVFPMFRSPGGAPLPKDLAPDEEVSWEEELMLWAPIELFL